MRLPSRKGSAPKKWNLERILAHIYLILFLLMAVIILLRIAGVLPGPVPSWHICALLILGLIALLFYFFSLSPRVCRILWIPFALILILWVLNRQGL